MKYRLNNKGRRRWTWSKRKLKTRVRLLQVCPGLRRPALRGYLFWNSSHSM